MCDSLATPKDIREIEHGEIISDLLPEIREKKQYLLYKSKEAPNRGLSTFNPMHRQSIRFQNLHQLGEFEVISLLGKGSFGFVWCIRQVSTDKVFALKIIPKKSIIQYNDVDHVNLEREILQALGTGQHPFIVQFYYALQDSRNIFFVMDVRTPTTASDSLTLVACGGRKSVSDGLLHAIPLA